MNEVKYVQVVSAAKIKLSDAAKAASVNGTKGAKFYYRLLFTQYQDDVHRNGKKLCIAGNQVVPVNVFPQNASNIDIINKVEAAIREMNPDLEKIPSNEATTPMSELKSFDISGVESPVAVAGIITLVQIADHYPGMRGKVVSDGRTNYPTQLWGVLYGHPDVIDPRTAKVLMPGTLTNPKEVIDDALRVVKSRGKAWMTLEPIPSLSASVPTFESGEDKSSEEEED